ncbi:Hypothetical protein, putative [Bodo saltans]|uniref:Uncharacterized protein n=1 Tax=Bodo saltans TaxID=75058 RepID=A0A0S4KFF0_BODSA|nr:Hypothetical protein, putative [Bodo saltans]|eukprot:CUI14410.1 Hypothetical protein, putative [Bodo saltans]
MQYQDPMSLHRAPSSRSVSQATSTRASAIDDRLRQAEAAWKNKVALENGRRQDAMARARYYEQASRERTAAKLRAEEAESQELQRRNAEETLNRIQHRRSNSIAMSHRMEHLQNAEVKAADRKREQLDEKLYSSAVRHAQEINGRRNSLAQQRSFRQAVQEANIRQLEKTRSTLTSRILDEAAADHQRFSRSGSVTTTMTARSSSRAPNHVAATAQRAHEIQELRTLERLRKINEEEQRSQLALAKKQEALEERRQTKSVKELEAKSRVARRDKMLELTARRHEAKFQETIEVGNRVAAFNSICRANF